MHAIVHFEIPSDDIERARKFYGTLFGWKLEKVPGDMEYWMGSANEEQTMGVGLMKGQQPTAHHKLYRSKVGR